MRQIIGVLPRDFQFLDDQDAAIFMPFQWDRSKVRLGHFSQRGLARLKPGVTLQQANADLTRLVPIANRSFPPPDGVSASIFEKAGLVPTLRFLKQDVIGNVGDVLWVLMGSIAVVLLVACTNVANLLLVRVEGRRQELAIRSALGAQRNALTGLFVRQGLLLTAIGAACGLVVAFATMRLMSSILFNVSPVDPFTYSAITCGVLATAWLACYLPSRRAASVNPVNALRSE
jgi:hypothetical protein